MFLKYFIYTVSVTDANQNQRFVEGNIFRRYSKAYQLCSATVEHANSGDLPEAVSLHFLLTKRLRLTLLKIEVLKKLVSPASLETLKAVAVLLSKNSVMGQPKLSQLVSASPPFQVGICKMGLSIIIFPIS